MCLFTYVASTWCQSAAAFCAPKAATMSPRPFAPQSAREVTQASPSTSVGVFLLSLVVVICYFESIVETSFWVLYCLFTCICPFKFQR